MKVVWADKDIFLENVFDFKVKVKLDSSLDKQTFMPVKAHESDAGFDLKTPETVDIPAHTSKAIDTGVGMLIPDGYVGMLKSKSGLNVKHSIRSEGVIDAGYTGNIVVKLYNDGDNDYHFDKGDKITQIVILPIPKVITELVDEFDETDRGSNGFGSSGK